MTRRRYILLSCALAFALLLLLEALVRISGFVDIRRTRGWGHSYECCSDLRPNKEILSLVVKEHPYVVTTNNLGLRNDGDTSIDDTDSFRVLAIGDSFTFGPYVANTETWPARLEQLLRSENPERQIEVLNAGIASYTITDELDYLKEKGLALNPDLLILEVTFNDVADMRKIQRGYFARPREEDWKTRTTQSLKNFLYDHSYLVAGLVELKNARVIQNIQGSREQGDVLLYQEILYGKNNDFDPGYAEVFSQLVSFTSENKIPLALFFYPESTMVSDETRDGDKTKMASFVKNLAAEYNVPFLDATDFLRNTDPVLTYLLPWNGHPSTTGYYLTAQNLLHFLQENGLLSEL